MDFSSVVQAQIDGETVRYGVLVEMHFLSGVQRVWTGAPHKLTTADGREWRSFFGVGSVDGIAQSVGGSAPEMRLILSGVDETFALKAKGESEEYMNRLVFVYLQFFDRDWGLLDDPLPISWGKMRSLIPEFTATDDGALYSITLTAENPFGETKVRPAYSYVSPADQEHRYPGDRGFERVPGLETKLVVFPT